jgi:general secretion pathway protein L
MPSLSRDLRVFGLDLGALWSALRRPWQGVLDGPVVSVLAPDQPVLVLRADAQDACWQGVRGRAAAPPSTAPALVAVALPDSIVLHRTVVLPQAALAEAGQALALQVQGWNPFPAADLVWGWRRRISASGAVEADVALVSRKQVAGELERLRTRLDGLAPPEVWVCLDDGPPIVLPGHGDGRREAEARCHWRLWGALLGLAVLLAAMVASTPSLQLWLRQAEAARVHGELALRARPVLAQRESLVQAQEVVAGVSKLLQGRIDPLRVLEVLTRELPDGSAVQSLRLQGDTVTISGLTGDAAKLMQRLGQQPGLRDVRAPTAAMRQPGAASETFTVTFQVDPEKFAVRGGP